MPPFPYCLNTSTIRPASLMEKIAIAGRVGYSAVELWHDDLDEFLARGGTFADIRHALDDYGLVVPTTIYLKGWFETTGAEHAVELAECRRRLEQAAEVGALYSIAGPPMGMADHEQGARNYYELVELGLSLGVRPAMEFLGFVEDINTMEKGMEIVEQAGHPEGTLVLDPFHIYRGGGSFDAIADLEGDRIAICHFNDAPEFPPQAKQQDGDRVYPGEGILNLKKMLALLAATGYRHWLSLELFNEALWAQDPEEVARTGLEKMRAVAEG